MIFIKNTKYYMVKLFLSDVDGTLTDGNTYYSEKGEELKRFNHKDGRGVHLLKKAGIKFGIITGENSSIVLARAKKLNADYCFVGIENKIEVIKKLLDDLKINSNDLAYIGDDTNDLDAILFAGLSFAPADSHQEVLDAARIICKRNGGNGAFREAVDFILSK
jgi:YrbI family 3-deoxy-D-manno-octulosonate 8-phosphate phosphatase